MDEARKEYTWEFMRQTLKNVAVTFWYCTIIGQTVFAFVCFLGFFHSWYNIHTHTHTHTHLYIYTFPNTVLIVEQKTNVVSLLLLDMFVRGRSLFGCECVRGANINM